MKILAALLAMSMALHKCNQDETTVKSDPDEAAKQQVKQVKALQGMWRASGELPDDRNGTKSWVLTYTFEGEAYRVNGYPPITESGTFEVAEQRGDSIRLHFAEVMGTDTVWHAYWAVMTSDKKIMVLKGKSFEKM